MDVVMQMLKIKIPVSASIEEVLEYIIYSEMGGHLDPSDPWYSTYESLLELQEKVLDEEESDNLS